MPLKLFKRSGKWHYRGTIAGNRLRGSTGATSKEIAARITTEIEHRAWQRRLGGPQEALTFPMAVTYYLKADKLDHSMSRCLGLIEDYWKNAKVVNMTAGAIRQSAIDLMPTQSGATRNRKIITLTQAIINHCAELELCPPIRIRRFESEKKIRQPITLEWINAFCAAAPVKTAALALFLFSTGCRISESRRLEWSDIDFQNRKILIRSTKTKTQHLRHMPNRLLIALANLPRDKPPFWQSEKTLRRAWDATINTANLPKLSFHCCRHGFATALLQSGLDVVTVAKLGGWSSPQMVLSSYAHSREDAKLTERLFNVQVVSDERSKKA